MTMMAPNGAQQAAYAQMLTQGNPQQSAPTLPPGAQMSAAQGANSGIQPLLQALMQRRMMQQMQGGVPGAIPGQPPGTAMGGQSQTMGAPGMGGGQAPIPWNPDLTQGGY